MDAFAPIQTVCFRGSLKWFLVWCKNIHHDIGPSDKKIRRLQVQPDAAGGEFFILSEFTIESIQISIPQSPNAPILQKSARFASSDPALPSRAFGNCRPRIAKYAAAVREIGKSGGGNRCRRHSLAVLSAIQKGLRLRLNGCHHIEKGGIGRDYSRHVGGRWLVYLGRKVQELPSRKAVRQH